MAFSYGRQFRRIAAQALTADPGEMRALIARILPARADGAAPVLRIETEADCKITPAVVVAAFLFDVLTGDEAADLLRKTEDPAFRKQVREANHALAASYPAWGAPGRGEALVNRHSRPLRSHWDAPPQLVNNKENTSAPERPP